MREKRATTSAALYPAIPRLAGDIAASGRKNPDLVHKQFTV
jgi:hypothetical protein